MNIHSSHAAGRAAYTRQTSPSQGAEQSQQSPKSEEASSTPETSEQKAVQGQDEDTLTTQEQEMIEKNFPDDPELSMRLYGRGQGEKTVNPNAVGRNLDVTG